MIVDLITVGKPDDLLGVAMRMVFWNYGSVRDDVVDEAGADGPGEAEIVDLNWSRTHGKDAGSGVLSESFQVDQDVDLQGPDQVRDLVVALRFGVDEAFESRLDPPPHVGIVVRTDRNSADLE